MYQVEVKQNESQLFLVYSLECQYFDRLIERVPPNLLTRRSNNYSITDSHTKIQYQVSYTSNLTLTFRKQDLIYYDISNLIESLGKKLKSQCQFMNYVFSLKKEIQYSYIKQIEYSPTDLVFEIQFGNMLVCQFYISYIIGNSLMDISDSFFKIMLIKAQIMPGNKINQEIFSPPPLNLHLYSQVMDIQKIFNLTYNTFIPNQILLSKFQDDMLFKCFQSFVNLTPIQQFANFQFGIRSDKYYPTLGYQPLFVLMQTQFKNDKLCITIEEGEAYAALNGYYSKIDFQSYKKEITQAIKIWEFSSLQEVDEFFTKFLYITLGFVLLYQKREQLIQTVSKFQWDLMLKNVLKQLIARIYQLTISFSEKGRGEILSQHNNDYRRITTLATDRYFGGLLYLVQSEDRENSMKFFFKQNLIDILQTCSKTSRNKIVKKQCKNWFRYKQLMILIRMAIILFQLSIKYKATNTKQQMKPLQN